MHWTPPQKLTATRLDGFAHRQEWTRQGEAGDNPCPQRDTPPKRGPSVTDLSLLHRVTSLKLTDRNGG